MNKIMGIIIVCMLFFGCAITSKEMPRLVQEKDYLEIIVSRYTAKYEQADMKTKIQWRHTINPQIKKAHVTLFSWENAVLLSEPIVVKEKERRFLFAKERLILNLIREGVE